MAFALLTLVLLAEGSMADWGLETRILDTIQNVAEVVAKESYLLVDAYYGLTLAEGKTSGPGGTSMYKACPERGAIWNFNCPVFMFF